MRPTCVYLLALFCCMTLNLSPRFVNNKRLVHHKHFNHRKSNLFKCSSYENKTKSSSSNRIIGGRNAKPGEFPYQVQLFVEATLANGAIFQYYCGGSIIDEWHILTAAHCVTRCNDTISLLVAFVGDLSVGNLLDGQKWFQIHKSVVHRDYEDCRNITIAQNDIALLKVVWPMELKLEYHGYGSVSSISLPNNEDGVETDDILIASGWGYTQVIPPKKSDMLQQTRMRVTSFEECFAFYQMRYGFDIQLDRDKHICLNTLEESRSSTCFGDSGGPIAKMINGKPHIIGITSQGSPECTIGEPSIYTRVSHYLSWIETAKELMKD